MSYLVFCTFDLKSASSKDYGNAYGALANIGLKKVIVADNGNDVVIPTTSAIGTFDGVDAAKVRDDILDQVVNAFKALRLKSEIFLIVGGNWAWGAKVT